MPDAVLIAHKDQAQNVKTVVKNLKEREIQQPKSLQLTTAHGGGLKPLLWDSGFRLNV